MARRLLLELIAAVFGWLVAGHYFGWWGITGWSAIIVLVEFHADAILNGDR